MGAENYYQIDPDNLQQRVGVLRVGASKLDGLVSWELVLLNPRLVP